MVDVVFYKKTVTADSGGALQESWAEVGTVTGILDDVNSTERIIAEKNGYSYLKKFFCEYPDLEITEGMKAEVLGNSYKVQYVKNPNHLDRRLEVILGGWDE